MAIPSIKLSGMRELQTALEKLPKELRRTAESAALRGGMEPVRKAAKGNLAKSKDTGLLQSALGLTVRKTRKGQLTARVGARSGFKKSVTRKGRKKPEMADPTKYAHLVEYGTSRAPAQPFIRPALDSSQDQITDGLAKGYAKGLASVVKRIRRS